MLLTCPQAREVRSFFHLNIADPAALCFDDFLLSRCHNYVQATIHTAIA
jgi:hypothetical protein